MHHVAPSQKGLGFSSWWCKANKQVVKQSRQGIHSLVTLGAWWIWKHRNDCIFNSASPSVQTILCSTLEEGGL
uniref:Uncharacterized protein n=1 Tax=Arundo donax TaxID=35708 RepID=A0A0A9DF02_ARUDO